MLPLVRNSKPHLYGFIASVLVLVFGGIVLFGLHEEQRGRERIEQLRADWHDHLTFERDARHAAMERLNRIRAELASSTVPDWAGEYSLVIPTVLTCAFADDGTDGDHHEGFALAPESGAVWWYGTGDIPTTTCVDHGDIVHVEDGKISVAWTLNERDPHKEMYLPWNLLDREIVRLGSGERTALIPASRMPLYCATAPPHLELEAASAPMKGGADDKQDGFARLEVPEAWREYTLPSPLRSTCEFQTVECVPPRWSWTRFPPWREWTADDEQHPPWRASATCSVPLGSRIGLRVGMPMYLPEHGSLTGRVTHVSQTEARVEFVGYHFRGDPEFRTGEPISSQLFDGQ